MVPEQPATGGDADEREQEHESDRDPGGQRQHVTEHGQADDRQYESDDDPLPERQPWRPTRRQAHRENQAARDQR